MIQSSASRLAAALLGLAAASAAHAFTIDFESYTAGANIVGQNGGSGTAWAGSNVGNTVVLDAGNQYLAMPATLPASANVSNRFAATDSEIGAPFASDAVVDYSFDLRSLATPGTQDFSFVANILLGSTTAGNINAAAVRIGVRSNGQFDFYNDGTAVRVTSNGLTSGGSSVDLDNVSGFATLSGQINYATETFTIFYNGVQQLQNGTGDFAFRGASSVSWTAYGNAFDFAISQLDANEHRPLAFDNISFTAIPEPSSVAALAGLGALGLVSLRRRRA